MKKLFALLAVIILGGCVTATPVSVPPQSHEVKIIVQSATDAKVEVSDKDKITRTMEVPNDEPAWPNNVMLIGDTVHYTLWAYIDVSDPLHFWKTVNIARHRGIKKIHLYINSGGGSAFAGLGFADNILTAIADGFTVTTEANGIVASAAVPIFAVGQKRAATKGTMFMLHEGKLFKFFSEESRNDLASQKRMMDLLEDRYNQILKDHSKLTLEQIQAKCAATTWFTAEEALEWGLVDLLR